MKLVIENISKEFNNAQGKTLPVLQDINLTINKEEFVALVGPSGCGKSTLLNLAAGLLEPSSGTIKRYEFFLIYSKVDVLQDGKCFTLCVIKFFVDVFNYEFHFIPTKMFHVKHSLMLGSFFEGAGSAKH